MYDAVVNKSSAVADKANRCVASWCADTAFAKYPFPHLKFAEFAEEYLTQVLKKGTKFKKMDSEMNFTTKVNLCPYSSYRQLAPQQDYISSEQFMPQTRWYPSCPPHMIAWIQHSMGFRRLTTSLHQDGRQPNTWRVCYPLHLSEMWDTKAPMP